MGFFCVKGERMNVSQIMNKLQRAITSCGLIICVNKNQFYSADQKRYITMYGITTPILYRNKYGEWKNGKHEIIRTSSVRDVLDTLQEIYKAVKEWGS